MIYLIQWEVRLLKIISMPVKGYTKMPNPHGDNGPQKVRFYTALRDVPEALTEWMSTNPREQNLSSSVAKAISESIHRDSRDFHLKNRGILLSAKEVNYTPSEHDNLTGTIDIVFEDPMLHGNVDGGHTLRLILASHGEENLPEQYVEFEVIVGLSNLLPIAEARNTSVAVDVRTMEEMKGSFNVLKSIFSDVEIQGDRFFNRVELKMNQQLEEQNHIDIRMLISVLMMFNQELFPVPQNPAEKDNSPVQMYGNKEAALEKYLSLGGGSSDKRDEVIRNMSPIMIDILNLWNTIERELPQVDVKKYSRLPFVEKSKSPRGIFSNAPLEYAVPQSIMFPFVAAFRPLIQINNAGLYGWADSPFEAWKASKKSMSSSLFDTLRGFKNNPTVPAKKATFWYQYYQIIMLYRYRNFLK